MSRRLDLVGRQFGLLTVIQPIGFNRRRQSLWLCKCVCGRISVPIAGYHLTRGDVRSCGCQLGLRVYLAARERRARNRCMCAEVRAGEHRVAVARDFSLSHRWTFEITRHVRRPSKPR